MGSNSIGGEIAKLSKDRNQRNMPIESLRGTQSKGNTSLRSHDGVRRRVGMDSEESWGETGVGLWDEFFCSVTIEESGGQGSQELYPEFLHNDLSAANQFCRSEAPLG